MEGLELLSRCLSTNGKNSSVNSVAYVALAGRDSIRWILPKQSTVLAGLLSSWQPYSTTAKLGWKLVHTAASWNSLSYLPNTEIFSFDISDIDWCDYGWESKGPPIFIAYVGTPGTHHKLVIVLADAHKGIGCLVIKYPLVSTAWPKIMAEYNALKDLRYEGVASVPKPVVINHVKRFSVQSYLDGSPLSSAKLTTAHYKFLAGLCKSGTSVSLESFRTHGISRLNQLGESGRITCDEFAHFKKTFASNEWHGEVPGVRVHGDFAPWNLKYCDKTQNTICAVDWEDSQATGLPFYDLYFYKFQVEKLIGKRVTIDSKMYINALLQNGYELNPGLIEKAEYVACCIAKLSAWA